MKAEEFQEILNWISRPDVLANLPLDEQLCVQMAMLKMCESLKPLYDKYNYKIMLNNIE